MAISKSLKRAQDKYRENNKQKGMMRVNVWVPEDMDDQDIPQNIVDLCIQKFGIDPNGCGEQVVLQ